MDTSNTRHANKPSNARLEEPGDAEEEAGTIAFEEDDLGRAFRAGWGDPDGDTSEVDPPKDLRMSFIPSGLSQANGGRFLAAGKVIPKNPKVIPKNR